MINIEQQLQEVRDAFDHGLVSFETYVYIMRRVNYGYGK